MIRMDHFSIYVSDDQVSKRWYAENFGLEVEFEVPERNTVALVDDADVTLFLVRDPERAGAPHGCELTFQVDEVHRKHDELKGRGVRHPRGRSRSCLCVLLVSSLSDLWRGVVQ